jgi:hypothetical protein
VCGLQAICFLTLGMGGLRLGLFWEQLSGNRYTKRYAVSSQPLPSDVWDSLYPLGDGSSVAALMDKRYPICTPRPLEPIPPRTILNVVDDGSYGAQPSESYVLVHMLSAKMSR